jgi:acetoacetyl-CoA synthetase
LKFDTYEALWRWSVEELEGFWGAVWEYFDVKQSRPYERVLANAQMPGAQWFPGAQLNFVEQVFRHADRPAPAIVYESEAKGQGEISWPELKRQVAALSATLRNLGVGPGDRVVGYLPNVPEAAIALLAVVSIGAVWSVCSPEMGVLSVTERFAQIEPKILITVDGYRYAGKDIDRGQAVSEILAALRSVKAVLWVDLLRRGVAPAETANGRLVKAWSEATRGTYALQPLQVPFEHPLWIVYSSGTTGLPKAIVHSHGGVLSMGLVVMSLHKDIQAGDRFLWYSSTGWIMWNIQVMGLLLGATICLFDGAVTGSGPTPEWSTLWRLASRQRLTFFGAGAAYFANCLKAGIRPGDNCDLSALRSVGSTGSPLSNECYRWIYSAVKKDVWLLSVSGGTDISGAFINGSPTLPVYEGEMQCRNLGVAVYAFDEHGKPVLDQVGELVCTKPIPSMPIRFWNDPGDRRYLESYFDTFTGPNGERFWRHGDWLKLVARPEATGAVIYGRSDATINRLGIRMGTAELYRVVEAHPDVLDSIAIDLEYLGRPSYLGLFVVLREGLVLTDPLARELKERIKKALSPRHTPDEVLQIAAVPRTLTGKKLEVPIKRLLLGHSANKVLNLGAVANPESVDWFLALASRRGLSSGA